MSLDLPTSFYIPAFTLLSAGGLLLLSWMHQQSDKPLVQWGLAFFMGALAVSLIAARGHIPDFLSIFVANLMLATAYGMLWKGVRTFERRATHGAYVFAGAMVWTAACYIPAFYAAVTARAMLMMTIGMTYTLLAAGEFWRNRNDVFKSRWPIIVVLTAHAMTLPFRVPLASSLSGASPPQAGLLAFVMFESILFCMCAAYLFNSLTKERVADRYRQFALLDPLTGVPNRRAFLQQATRILSRSGVSRRPVGLLLFDLDRFKEVNDKYGHAAGDEALVSFCRVATNHLRPTDLFARLGGEEFACLLPDTSHRDAHAIADRIRASFEATAQGSVEAPFTVTVSVGTTISDSLSIDLPSLMLTADRALYRAKQEGRNRVEPAPAVAHPATLRRIS